MANIGHSVSLVVLLGGLTMLASCTNDGVEPEYETPVVRAPLLAPLDDRACPGEDADTADARRAIARARAMVGLPALRCDAAALEAAQGHCGYLAANGEPLTHVQTRGRPGFTGVNFTDRLERQRFVDAPAGEVIGNITGAPVVEGSRGFLNSVYHRAPFLRAETVSFGYGHLDGCATIDFGRAAKPSSSKLTVVWPPDGAEGVPPVFHSAAELPNPMPGTTVVGAPISLIREATLTTITAELTGPDGVVDAVLLTRTTDGTRLIRAGEAHLVPRLPLAPHALYHARFSVRDAGKTVEFRTSFTTGGE